MNVAVPSRGRPRIVVVGGGLAGLAAALKSADLGMSVTLLERRPRLGGLTWSFERNGVWYDNGQHVFMRCCTAYRSFLRRVGSDDGVFLQSRLEVPVLSPGRRPGVICRREAPAGLHLLRSLLTYSCLSFPERLSVLRTALALRSLDPDDRSLDRVSFGEWLSDRGTSPRAVQDFWNLVVLPTVNLPAERASLKLAARVCVTGLLRHRAAADIGWPLRPLSELHAVAGRRALEKAGAEVLTGVRVEALRPLPEGLEVLTEGGRRWEADAVVVAVPHEHVAELLPQGFLANGGRLGELGHSPIVNVHLIYDRPVTELHFAAGTNCEIQFVFDRTQAAGLTDGRQCLAVSLSAADGYIGMPSAELIERFDGELRRLLPAAAGARLTDSMVTRERAATFCGSPGSDSLRAPSKTKLAGVYLAGAWCDTGWPATMEGAVRSGVQAARLALEETHARTAL